MSVLSDIKEQYPSLAFLANDPEVGPLLRDAVDPNKGFSPTTFQAKLYQTKWFRTRSVAQREYSIMYHSDPAELKRRRAAVDADMRAIAHKAGITITGGEAKWLTTYLLANGLDAGSPEGINMLRSFMRNTKTNRFGASGSVAAAATTFRNIAKNQYYLPIDQKEAHRWGIELALGVKDESAVKELMSQRAMSRFPHLKELLKNGATMEEIFSGHRALIAQELELNPTQIDFTKDWVKVLQQTDPQTKKPRPMTLHETQTLARQDKRWWRTTKGREQDAGMANFFLKTFGKRA